MDIKHYILNEEHIPVEAPLMKWARWLESDPKHRRVAFDEVNGYDVSTVFLGLNHNFQDDGPPLLFETMIFINNERRDDFGQWRYSTWKLAIEGHRRACQLAVELSQKGES